MELAGWPYPRHLAGRTFSVVVHGDAAGVGTLRRSLTDWLTDIGMIPAGYASQLGAYVGYLAPYATSHDELDRDDQRRAGSGQEKGDAEKRGQRRIDQQRLARSSRKGCQAPERRTWL